MLHITQKLILDRLARADAQRYSQIKPSDIDGNTFGYHLKQTMSDGLVEKLPDGSYSLTEAGKKYIIGRLEDPLEAAHSIFLLVIKYQGRYLVRRRTIQPTLGLSGFIHGEPQVNQGLLESARQRLLQKSGLDCADLSVASSGLITIKRGNELESYSHVVVVTGTVSRDDILPGDDTGENYWTSPDQLDQPNFIPSCQGIIDSLNRQDSWFELSYSI